MTVQRFVHVNRANAMLVAFVGLLVIAAAGATPTRATSRLVTPRTLFIEQGTIHKFAQDGDRIAWVGGRHFDVHLRGVSKRHGWLLGHAGPGRTFNAHSASRLVLGGARAVWVKSSGLVTETVIYASKPGQKNPSLIDTLYVSDWGSGTYLTSLAASGDTILYAVAKVDYTPGEGGGWSLTGGGVRRFAGHPHSRQVHGIPPAFRIATTGRRIAVVPAVLGGPIGADLTAAPNGPVNVYDLTGHRLAQVVPQGTVREVALDWPDLAVIVTRPDGTTVIERYIFLPEGRLLGATDMPGASDLSIARGKVVFRVDNTIYMWWTVPKRPTVLWRSLGKPIGLSIEGKRVAWAANGRIRALTLPR